MFKKILPLVVLGILGSLSAQASSSSTDFLLEPGFGYVVGTGRTTITEDAGTASETSMLYDPGINHGVAGTFRAGLIREGLFSAIDFNYSYIFAPASVTGISLGVSVGGSLTYLPFRVWGGVYFLDKLITNTTISSSNGTTTTPSTLSFSGQSFKAGIGMDVSDSMVANLEIVAHNFDEADFSTSTSSTTINFKMTTITLSLSMPMTIFMPKTPWRKQRSDLADVPAP